jgi:glyoxylase-like metal-dependent hydrolase (beta-lactamase superfamily II)
MRVVTIPVGALQSNCYLVADSETREAVVIDPGDESTIILEQIDQNNLIIQAILLTHAHFDHIMAVRPVRDALNIPIYMHQDDAYIYDHVETLAAHFGIMAEPPVPVDRYFEENDTIDFGSISISVISTPGHSPGGVSFLITGAPSHVFSGDTLFSGSIGRTDLPGGDSNLLLQSIHEKLIVLDDTTIVYPGHGPASTIGTEKRSNPYLYK